MLEKRSSSSNSKKKGTVSTGQYQAQQVGSLSSFLFRVSCFTCVFRVSMFHVSCFTFHVSRFVFRVSCVIFHVSCFMFHVPLHVLFVLGMLNEISDV